MQQRDSGWVQKCWISASLPLRTAPWPFCCMKCLPQKIRDILLYMSCLFVQVPAPKSQYHSFSLFLILHLLLCFDPLNFILLFAFVLLLYKLLFVPHFLPILIIPILYFMTFFMSFHFHLFSSPNPPALTATSPPHSSRLVSPIKAQRVGAQVSLCPPMWAHWAKQRTNPAQPRGGALPVLPRWLWPWALEICFIPVFCASSTFISLFSQFLEWFLGR